MLRFRPLLTLVTIIALVGASFATTGAAEAQTASRDTAREAGFLASLNAERAARGVAPLTLNSSMSMAAAGWTAQMVQGTFLAHADDIVSGTPSGWTKVGENVGRGQSVTSLTQSFMNSPGHARNVLDPEYTHVGIAVIQHPNGRVYTTHRFAALPSGLGPGPATIATPAPAAEPTPTPPAAEPTPTPVVAATIATSPQPDPDPTAMPSRLETGDAPRRLAFVAASSARDATAKVHWQQKLVKLQHKMQRLLADR